MAGGHGGEGDGYHPQDAIKNCITAALTYGGVGLFAASIQSALQRQPVGSMAAFTRFGGNIGTFGQSSSRRGLHDCDSLALFPRA